MAINPYVPGSFGARTSASSFVDMRAQLNDLQRQLATQQRSETFGGLGFDRRISLDVRGKLALLDGYQSSIKDATVRLNLLIGGIEQMASMAQEARGDLPLEGFQLNSNGRTAGQGLAEDRLRQALDILNTDVNGRYLYAGRASDVKPVESFDLIMNGDTTRDGVTTLIAERKAADLGVGGQGRLTVTAGATTTTITDAGAVPFGFKLAGASSTSANITATFSGGPGLPYGDGPPAVYTSRPAESVTFDVTAQPADGEKVRILLNLPDGTQKSLELTARAAPVPASNASGFAIGATAADTSANLTAAVNAALTQEAQTSLAAASATLASQDFFFQPENLTPPQTTPRRVVGGTPATATAYGVDPAKQTVDWYKGEDAGDARSAAAVRIDATQTAGIGVQANEDAFAQTLAQFAVMTSENFSPGGQTERLRYEALAQRVRTNLGFPDGLQSIEEIGIEIASANVSINAAKERHTATASLLQDSLDRVEQVTLEEVAAQILALQTRLQASYQTTSIISQLSLVNFL